MNLDSSQPSLNQVAIEQDRSSLSSSENSLNIGAIVEVGNSNQVPTTSLQDGLQLNLNNNQEEWRAQMLARGEIVEPQAQTKKIKSPVNKIPPVHQNLVIDSDGILKDALTREPILTLQEVEPVQVLEEEDPIQALQEEEATSILQEEQEEQEEQEVEVEVERIFVPIPLVIPAQPDTLESSAASTITLKGRLPVDWRKLRIDLIDKQGIAHDMKLTAMSLPSHWQARVSSYSPKPFYPDNKKHRLSPARHFQITKFKSEQFWQNTNEQGQIKHLLLDAMLSHEGTTINIDIVKELEAAVNTGAEKLDFLQEFFLPNGTKETLQITLKQGNGQNNWVLSANFAGSTLELKHLQGEALADILASQDGHFKLQNISIPLLGLPDLAALLNTNAALLLEPLLNMPVIDAAMRNYSAIKYTAGNGEECGIEIDIHVHGEKDDLAQAKKWVLALALDGELVSQKFVWFDKENSLTTEDGQSLTNFELDLSALPTEFSVLNVDLKEVKPETAKDCLLTANADGIPAGSLINTWVSENGELIASYLCNKSNQETYEHSYILGKIAPLMPKQGVVTSMRRRQMQPLAGYMDRNRLYSLLTSPPEIHQPIIVKAKDKQKPTVSARSTVPEFSLIKGFSLPETQHQSSRVEAAVKLREQGKLKKVKAASDDSYYLKSEDYISFLTDSYPQDETPYNAETVRQTRDSHQEDNQKEREKARKDSNLKDVHIKAPSPARYKANENYSFTPVPARLEKERDAFKNYPFVEAAELSFTLTPTDMELGNFNDLKELVSLGANLDESGLNAVRTLCEILELESILPKIDRAMILTPAILANKNSLLRLLNRAMPSLASLFSPKPPPFPIELPRQQPQPVPAAVVTQAAAEIKPAKIASPSTEVKKTSTKAKKHFWIKKQPKAAETEQQSSSEKTRLQHIEAAYKKDLDFIEGTEVLPFKAKKSVQGGSILGLNLATSMHDFFQHEGSGPLEVTLPGPDDCGMITRLTSGTLVRADDVYFVEKMETNEETGLQEKVTYICEGDHIRKTGTHIKILGQRSNDKNEAPDGYIPYNKIVKARNDPNNLTCFTLNALGVDSGRLHQLTLRQNQRISVAKVNPRCVPTNVEYYCAHEECGIEDIVLVQSSQTAATRVLGQGSFHKTEPTIVKLSDLVCYGIPYKYVTETKSVKFAPKAAVEPAAIEESAIESLEIQVAEIDLDIDEAQAAKDDAND